MNKLILAFVGCAMLASCVKDEDKDPIDVSKTTYLLDGAWQLKAFMWLPDVNDPNSFPVDQYDPIVGCEKDNYWVFNSRSQVIQHEGLTKCSISSPDSVEFYYSLTSNDNYFRLWSVPDDADNSTLFAGEITYPSIDTFIVTSLTPNPTDSNLTSRYVRTYVKQK